jgi:P2 family phage contractile tail tube protein
MALPKKLKHFNLFGDGNNWQGQIASLTLPTLARNMEEYRGAGMDAPVDIDQGMEKLTFEWTTGGLIEAVFDGFGVSQVDGRMLRFVGSYVGDDTGSVTSVEVVVRGRHQQIEMGDAEPGSDNQHSITTTCSYYKLVIDGETVIEIDVPGFVFVVRGEDRMAEIRNSLGI